MEQLRAIEQNGKLTDAQKFRCAKFAVENAPIAKLDATDTNVGRKGGMKNADKIRAMDDEELAYFLKTTSCSICCEHPLNCGFDCVNQYTIKAEKTEQEEK